MFRLLVIAVLFSCAWAPGAEVRIEGLRTISGKQALSLIEGRLEFVLARPATASRADDAAYLLEGELKRRGYNDPQVRAEVRSDSLIVLKVEEGPLSTLGKVEVLGVDKELGKELANQFESAHRGKVRRVMERAPYLDSESAAGIDNATALMHSNGYWDARVTQAPPVRDPETGVTNVTLKVVPGPLFHLAQPRVSTSGVTAGPIEERLAGLAGEVANTANITLARSRVQNILQNRGFKDARFEMRARHTGGLTTLTFDITPGEQFTVGLFTATGEKDTKPHRISNRFKGVEGTLYDAKNIEKRTNKLFATGAFSGLRLDEAPQPDGTLDLTLHVTEGKPDGYYVYGGAGSYEGLILGAGYYHRNVLGNLWNLNAGVEISGLGPLGNVRLTDPFFLESDLRFSLEAFILVRGYDGWIKHEGGFGAELDWDVTEHYSLKFSFRNSYVANSRDGLSDAFLGPKDYLLTNLGVRQVYDRRDDPTLPTKGFYASLATDMGFALGDSSMSFLRADGKVAGWLPVTDKSWLAAAFRAGIIVPSADQLELPIDLRFFTGGASSVRSFPERKLGPKSPTGYPLGGEAFWIANLEYIQRVKGPLRAVAFLDAGALSADHASFGDSDVEVAAGLGLRVDLPIGPLRLEYGYSLTQDPGEPSGAFHFSIGTTF